MKRTEHPTNVLLLAFAILALVAGACSNSDSQGDAEESVFEVKKENASRHTWRQITFQLTWTHACQTCTMCNF